MKPQMLLKLKRIKRQSRYQPMNEGHEASDDIKVKKNKKADFKTLGHSVRCREREREREKVKNLEELREGRTAGAGAEEATSQRQISDE